jgi:hypothetical protein
MTARILTRNALSAADPNLSARQEIEAHAFTRLAGARKQYWSHVTQHDCRLAAGTPETRFDIETRLRDEMREARHKFVAASDQFDQLIVIGLDAPGSADGRLAREQAIRLREAAFKQYDAALRRNAEFITGETSHKVRATE